MSLTIKALQFAYSIIYCCFSQSLSQDFAILNELKPPDNYYINKAFEIIRTIIEQLARDSALRANEQMPDDTTICMDGSWAIRDSVNYSYLILFALKH